MKLPQKLRDFVKFGTYRPHAEHERIDPKSVSWPTTEESSEIIKDWPHQEQEVDKVTKVSEELKSILNLQEVQDSIQEIQNSIQGVRWENVAILPSREQARAIETVKQRELTTGQECYAGQSVSEIVIEAYEVVQRNARQYIKEHCEQRLGKASNQLVETRRMKEYVENRVAQKFSITDYPAATEIMQYSEMEPLSRFYDLLLRLFSEQNWFRGTIDPSDSSREFFSEAQMLGILASSLGNFIAQEIESEDQHEHDPSLVRMYEWGLGPSVSFRIKAAFQRAGFAQDGYTQIFDILGKRFYHFMNCVGMLGKEKQKEIVDLFGRILRYHCVKRFPSGWRTLRDLIRDFQRWHVLGVREDTFADLFGSDKSEDFANWFDRARWAAKPDGNPEGMEEILQELETAATRQVSSEQLLQQLEGLVKTEYPFAQFYLYDPFKHGLSFFHYYPTILFQERIEKGLKGDWSRWQEIDERWRLRAILRKCLFDMGWGELD